MSTHMCPDCFKQWVELVEAPPTEEEAGGEGEKEKEEEKEGEEKEGEEREGEEKEEDEGEEKDEKKSEASIIGNQFSTVSIVMRRQEADAAEIAEALSLEFVSRAVHTLTEAVSLAMSSKQWVCGPVLLGIQ